jgi:hypothetical protein
MADPHVEAGERPDRHFVHALERLHAVQPWQRIVRCQLAPAHGDVAGEGEQARRRTTLNLEGCYSRCLGSSTTFVALP